MIRLNEEQKVARLLQSTNTILGVIAFIPAFLCWFPTIIFHSEMNQELTFFICSSVLLFVFYGYTFISPRIYIHEYYNKSASFWYWIIVLITNVLTVIHFLANDNAVLAVVPAIPLVISISGLIAHYFINYKKNNSNDKIK